MKKVLISFQLSKFDILFDFIKILIINAKKKL